MRLGILFGAIVVMAFPAVCARNDDPRVAVTPRETLRSRVQPDGTLRVDVKLILIPATVTDPFGAPFSGLPQEAFRLFEDGVEQELKYFSSDDAPISLGVVFDSSRIMEHKLSESRAAVKQFFGTAIPGDEFLLVEFNDAPRLLCNFTRDTDMIERTLVDIKAKNWTALLDAVYLSMRQMKRASNPRKALLILSDGGDNNSRYTEAEMKALVREGDVCIYAIALPGGGLIKRHSRLLKQLSDETGGLFCQLERMADMPDTVAKISGAIRNQYLLGYTSNNPNNNGLYRKIGVRLNQRPDLPRLRASWRTGYYAPDRW
jgi:Ca-activated chloride channel family protein